MPTGEQADRSLAVMTAAMALAESRGWRRLTMAEIAEAAGVSLADIHEAFSGKPAILAGIARYADRIVLADSFTPSSDETPRDRLFDVVMRRFDALAPFKPGIAALARELPSSDSGLALALQLTRSMRWMLEAAGIGTAGIRGSVQVAGLAAIYSSVVRIWLRDDSLDLSKTMAELDRLLRRAEQIMNSLKGRARRPDSNREAQEVPEGDLDASI